MRRMRDFRLDPSTLKVDWALSGPIPWRTPPTHAPGTVHVADSVAELTETYAQIEAGAVPAAPFLLLGQMTTTDATRSPAGTESAWAYGHLPREGLTTEQSAGFATAIDVACEMARNELVAKIAADVAQKNRLMGEVQSMATAATA